MYKKLIVYLFLTSVFLAPKNLEARGYSSSHWYMSLSMGKETMNNEDSSFLNLESSYTAGLSLGHAFCLNHYSNGFNVYLDWTILDLRFSDYSKDYMAKYGAGKTYLYTFDVGTFVGPRVRIGSSRYWNVNVFAKYAPTFYNLTNGQLKQYDMGFAHQIATGADICYHKVALGVEFRKLYMDCDLVLKDDYANTEEYSTSITKTQRLNFFLRLTF